MISRKYRLLETSAIRELLIDACNVIGSWTSRLETKSRTWKSDCKTKSNIFICRACVQLSNKICVVNSGYNFMKSIVLSSSARIKFKIHSLRLCKTQTVRQLMSKKNWLNYSAPKNVLGSSDFVDIPGKINPHDRFAKWTERNQKQMKRRTRNELFCPTSPLSQIWF